MAAENVRILKEKNKVILEYIDFAWTEKEINQCKKLWNEGYGLLEIAKKIRHTSNADFETFALLYDLAQRGLIKERKGKVWGFMQ